MVVKSRGYGKTWLTALCCIAMGVLYPGSLIAVVSGTAEQATLIVKKIQDYFIHNPEIMREIQCDGHRPVQLSRNKGVCTLKNGSKIESYSVGTMRGNRAKIMVIDESPEVKADDLDAVIGPVRNTKRDICHQRGIADYPSKTISITSACLKSNYFYSMFVSALRDFAKGSRGSFACALDYRSAARVGITDMEFFRKEQRKMPEAKFAMEYGSISQHLRGRGIGQHVPLRFDGGLPDAPSGGIRAAFGKLVRLCHRRRSGDLDRSQGGQRRDLRRQAGGYGERRVSQKAGVLALLSWQAFGCVGGRGPTHILTLSENDTRCI